MPLLDRSTASLEPCNLHRALGSVRSRQRLRAAFWHHGAAGVELSRVWHTLVRDAPHEPLASASPGRPPSRPPDAADAAAPSVPSTAFTLDFLYPQLHRLWPVAGRSSCDRSELARIHLAAWLPPGARPYSSSSASSSAPSPSSSPSDPTESSPPRSKSPPKRPPVVESPLKILRKSVKGQPAAAISTEDFMRHFFQRPPAIPIVSTPEVLQDISLQSAAPALGHESELELEQRDKAGPEKSATERTWWETQESEESPDQEKQGRHLNVLDPDTCWQLFQKMGPEEQGRELAATILTLSHSDRLLDSIRVLGLIGRLPESEWTPQLTRAGIQAAVRQDAPDEAMQYFGRQIGVSDSPVGLGLILSYALDASRPDILDAAWGSYFAGRSDKPLLPLEDVRAILATPDLSAKLWRLSEHIGDELPNVESFLSAALTWGLHYFDSRTATSLVELSEDPLMYEELIRLSVDRGQKVLATHLYLKYRKLPDVKIRVSILWLMVKSVFTDSTSERTARYMELALKDWLSRHPHLDWRGYRRFLGFYALRGDLKSFSDMEPDFRKHYPWFVPQLLAFKMGLHSLRGNPTGVRQILDTMERDYGVKPKVQHWNELVRAYKNNHHAAVEAFAELMESVRPTAKSFSILMEILGDRGDLYFVLQLQQLAESRGVKTTTAMKIGIVDALCHAGCFQQALDACKEDTIEWQAMRRRAMAKPPGDAREMEKRSESNRKTRAHATRLWNVLLLHYARQRDLKELYKTLRVMASLDVAYDGATYFYLLLGLAYCRQSHHALQLVRAAHVSGYFRPNRTHYEMLLASFIGSDEPSNALHVRELMRRHGFESSTESAMSRVLASMRLDEIDPRMAEPGRDPNVRFRRSVMDLLGLLRAHRDPSWQRGTVMRNIELPSELFASVIFYAVRHRRFVDAQELIRLYYSLAKPGTMQHQRGEIQILGAVMTFELYNKNYANVRAAWEMLLKLAIELGRPVLPSVRQSTDAEVEESTEEEGGARRDWRRNRGEIVPKWRTVVSGGFEVLQRALEAEGDAEGLEAAMDRVRAEGFEPSGRNWNFHVQALARMGKVEDAFMTSETMLMGSWQGWRQNRAETGRGAQLPLELVRLSRSHYHRRPLSTTLLELTRAWRQLSDEAPWSKEAERTMAAIQQSSPLSLRAALTLRPSDDPRERRILFGSNGRQPREQRGPGPAVVDEGAAQLMLNSFMAELTKEDATKAQTARKDARAKRKASRLKHARITRGARMLVGKAEPAHARLDQVGFSKQSPARGALGSDPGSPGAEGDVVVLGEEGVKEKPDGHASDPEPAESPPATTTTTRQPDD